MELQYFETGSSSVIPPSDLLGIISALEVKYIMSHQPKIITEAYSVAGEMGFGWWLVEHYFSYHVDCPDGCGLGEPAGGRKDPPYFQMSYGSFYYIADGIDSFVESFLSA